LVAENENVPYYYDDNLVGSRKKASLHHKISPVIFCKFISMDIIPLASMNPISSK
jgi:hypothetical protein